MVKIKIISAPQHELDEIVEKWVDKMSKENQIEILNTSITSTLIYSGTEISLTISIVYKL